MSESKRQRNGMWKKGNINGSLKEGERVSERERESAYLFVCACMRACVRECVHACEGVCSNVCNETKSA